MTQPHSHRRDAGFTLIEIMVVVVILGLLATIVTANVFPRRDEAQTTAVETNVKQIRSIAEAYILRSRTRRVPTIEQLQTPDENGECAMRGEATDPWGMPYLIVGDRPGTFEVISFGPDQTQGTDDDISSAGNRNKHR